MEEKNLNGGSCAKLIIKTTSSTYTFERPVYTDLNVLGIISNGTFCSEKIITVTIEYPNDYNAAEQNLFCPNFKP